MSHLVRMAHPRLGVRHVPVKAVNRMRQNGWQVAELNPPPREDEPPGSAVDPPPKPNRRRSSSATDEAPEDPSGAFSRPKTEQEGSN